MNVWVINPFDNLPLEGNRPQRYWLMARAFADAGHRVTLWTSDFSHATKKKRRLVNPSALTSGSNVCANFSLIQIPTLPYAKNVCWARVRSHRRLARDFERMALRRTDDAPDIVIASTPPLGLCAAALKVARRCGARFVCDIQDAWPETFGRLLPRGFGWLGGVLLAPMRLTARRIYRDADLVTGVSRRYAAISGRRDFHLSYHGIQSDEGSVPKRSSRDGGKNRLVYLGNLGAGYDLSTVIDALAKRSDLTLDIAGRGPQEASLRETVERLGVSGRVRFRGYLDADALEDLMERCDVGIIPMRDDSWVGLPYKLGDYLKAGLPVLSSLHGECGALLERLDFGRTYAFGSSDAFLAALDALPRTPVTLPDALRADRIYPRYVDYVC